VVGDKCGLTAMWSYKLACFGKCSVQCAYSVSDLWFSQIWLYFSYVVLINISSQN